MTTTPPDAPTEGTSPGGPRVTRDEIRDLGRLRRSVGDRRVAGVAGGLGRHLDIDPLVLRVAFVVLAFFGGAGLVVYGACWLLVPEEGSERAAVTLDDRSRGIALIVIGGLAAVALLGGAWGDHWFPWPLIAIGLVAFLVLGRKDKPDPGNETQHEPGTAYGPAPLADSSATSTTTTSYAAPPPPPFREPLRDPRRRGPILFGLTLALIALTVGLLGTIDLAGAHVAASAYPATALAVTAVMLLVGSVWGRAGGLVLLGVVCTLATAGTTVADELDGQRLEAHPTRATDVEDVYRIDAGEVVVDLSKVRNLEGLDGRTIELEARVGHLDLTVPRHGLDVELNADISGPGGYHLFRRDGGGIDEHLSDRYDGGDDVPTITINTTLDVGGIDARTR